MQVNITQPQRPMQSQPMGDMPGGMGSMGGMNNRRSGGSKGPWILLLIVVVLVLAGAAYLFRDKWMASSKDLSGYQAVFLTNGQVYFGRLSHAGSDYIRLTDIYYLQVNQQLQPTGANGAPSASAASGAQPQLSLVKLGNELHGPTDLMEINRSQVLFYEDLKSDGKVAQAIAAYKAGQGSGAAAPAANAPGAAPAPAPGK